MRERKETAALRGLEIFITTMFSLHHISILVIGLVSDWNIWAPIVIVAAIVIGWLLTITQYRTLHFRARILVILMQGSLIIYSLYSERLVYIFLPFVAIAVLAGLYGFLDLIWIEFVSILVIIAYHAFGIHSFTIETMSDFYEYGMPIANVFIILLVLYVWINNRNASFENTVRLISDLKHAEATKDDFLANVSHEIRTPINTINGMSEVALQENDVSKLQEELHAIQYAGRNLMGVVSDILDFSELQSGNMEIEEEAYNIQSTINDIIYMSLALKKDKEIEFLIDCDAELPNMLVGDEKKIRRVVMNLISNAIKFTNEGGVMLTIGFRREEYGINLYFEVKDTGIGMSQESLENLFTSFNQADMSRTKKNSGMGLGLSISQIIIQSMGGVITVKSKPQKGTTMTVVIPQKIVDDTPIVQIQNPECYNLLMYMDIEQFMTESIRDSYTKMSSHITQQLKLNGKYCRNLAELKRRVEHEHFTHAFIGINEYCLDKNYFDELSQQLILSVAMDYSQDNLIQNADIIHLYNPFYILPIASILNGTVQKGENAHQPHGLRFEAPRARVLVVDDNLMNIRVVEGLLAKYRIQVTRALSGQEALECVQKMKFDLIFMDHMMPDMDGVETFKAIRDLGVAYCKKVPIVALTANAIAGAREQFLRVGFQDFLEKPVESSVLERVLLRNLNENLIVTLEQQETEEMKFLSEERPLQTEEKQTLTVGNLDTTKGLLYCGGREAYLEILAEYAQKGADNYEPVHQFYLEEDWKNYTIAVHAIKSSMLAIGATDLSEQAKALEAAGKTDDIAYIKEYHECMMEEYRRVIHLIMQNQEVQHFLNKQQPKIVVSDDWKKPKKELSNQEFSDVIMQAEDAMYSFDEKLLIHIIQPLLDCSYGGVNLDKEIEKILVKIQMADYISAVDALRIVKERLEKDRRQTE